MPTIHEVQFHRSRLTGRFRATCSCGWCRVGSQEEVQRLAANHDIEWEAVEPAPQPAAVAP